MARGYPAPSGARSTRRSSGSRSRCSSSRRSSIRAGSCACATSTSRSSWPSGSAWPSSTTPTSTSRSRSPTRCMLYLLGRMLWIGLRRSRRRDPLRLLVPASWLVVGLLFLVGFRIGLNVADSNVIDVGYAGVIGADRLADGDKLWGAFPKDNEHGDTYGPVTYAAYVPFEQVLPWSGRWDDLPAAHAAADRLRPAVPGAALPHRPAHARADPRARARLRVGGEPVHALRAGLQRQRRARRPRSSSAPSRRRRRRPAAARSSRSRGWRSSRPWRWRRCSPPTRAACCASSSAARSRSCRACCWSSATAGCTSSTTARWASRPRAGRRSRSGACTGGTTAQAVVQAGGGAAGRRRRLPAAPARPRRALARWPPPCSSRCSSASRTGSTSTSCGSSGRCSSRCWATPSPPSATGRRPTPSSSRSLPAPAVAWR